MASCGICRGPYRDPRILACGHSFCMECLENQINFAGRNAPVQVETSRNIICSLCRENCPLQAGGLQQLLKNYALVSSDETQERYVFKCFSKKKITLIDFVHTIFCSLLAFIKL